MTSLADRPVILVPGASIPEKNRKVRGHLIARTRFAEHPGLKPERYDIVPVECHCGWEGTLGEWPEHRGVLSAGARPQWRPLPLSAPE